VCLRKSAFEKSLIRFDESSLENISFDRFRFLDELASFAVDTFNELGKIIVTRKILQKTEGALK
jgi:mRNA deadenylase 3'-5' endonuclease subunit Ccr4